MDELKLHGFWGSPYSSRVIWALKLKGINYEYIEEDLPTKSQLLLQYNPIHKKIPVLLHAGIPILESLIIVEYIDEMWPEIPLLPKDAYDKAKAKFWAKFIDDKGFTLFKILKSTGEEREKAIKEEKEVLKVLEEKALGDKKFFGGDELGFVDIAFGWMAHWGRVMEEIVGIKFVTPYTYPRLHAWIENFKEFLVIKENHPDHGRLFLRMEKFAKKI